MSSTKNYCPKILADERFNDFLKKSISDFMNLEYEKIGQNKAYELARVVFRMKKYDIICLTFPFIDKKEIDDLFDNKKWKNNADFIEIFQRIFKNHKDSFIKLYIDGIADNVKESMAFEQVFANDEISIRNFCNQFRRAIEIFAAISFSFDEPNGQNDKALKDLIEDILNDTMTLDIAKEMLK